ncbi:hypothetical protein GF327_06415 [Candidatus Woesearchaeota archaeon]|nr:hypothetical protein [Candidatus Woesearchaeota archaeon]
MKNNLNEHLENTVKIVEGEEKKPYLKIVKFLWSIAGKKNKNDRIYPKEVLESAVKKFKTELPVLGQVDHPESGKTLLNAVSHEIFEVWNTGNKFYAKAGLLKTTAGKNIAVLLKHGIQIGSSSRGFGDINKGIVEEGFYLESIDFVLSPSFGFETGLQFDEDFKNEILLNKESGKDDLTILWECGVKNPNQLKEFLEREPIHHLSDQEKDFLYQAGATTDIVQWLDMGKSAEDFRRRQRKSNLHMDKK